MEGHGKIKRLLSDTFSTNYNILCRFISLMIFGAFITQGDEDIAQEIHHRSDYACLDFLHAEIEV
jgi:hypothetical protein